MFFEKGAYDLASFNFGQSVQLELKAILLEYFGKESEVREFIRRHRNDIKALEDAYTDTRYEPVVYRDYDAEAIKAAAELSLQFVRSLVG
ncbi:HEPN domain-containing protein [Thermococcus barophilus]|uniref:HEPN domain-containing protein n=1 Tax=Thermococcus barophilus TaxID=55802 RepID=UPI0009D73721